MNTAERLSQRTITPVDDSLPKGEQTWETLYQQLLERHQRMHQAEKLVADLRAELALVHAAYAEDEGLYSRRGEQLEEATRKGNEARTLLAAECKARLEIEKKFKRLQTRTKRRVSP